MKYKILRDFVASFIEVCVKLTLNQIQNCILLESRPAHCPPSASHHHLHITHLCEGPVIYVTQLNVCSDISIVFLQ